MMVLVGADRAVGNGPIVALGSKIRGGWFTAYEIFFDLGLRFQLPGLASAILATTGLLWVS